MRIGLGSLLVLALACVPCACAAAEAARPVPATGSGFLVEDPGAPAAAYPDSVARSGAPAAAHPDSVARTPGTRVRAWQTGLLRPDRLEHATLSFTLALGAGVVTREPLAAAGGALALGLAKEVRDRRHGGFDPVDLLADVVGAGLAAWAADALTR